MMEGVKVEKGVKPPPKKPSRYYQGSATAATTANAEPGFQGRCDDLRGHVFDCSVGKQVDWYTVTMKEIAEYIGSDFTYEADIRWSLEHEEELWFQNPSGWVPMLMQSTEGFGNRGLTNTSSGRQNTKTIAASSSLSSADSARTT
jgi:hypothetical protein